MTKESVLVLGWWELEEGMSADVQAVICLLICQVGVLRVHYLMFVSL